METVSLDTPFQLREGLHKREIRRLAPNEVPIIDFGRIYGSNKSDQHELAQELRAACTGPGYFYLSNHQFPQTVIDRAYAAMQNFFLLPLEEKMKNYYLNWPNHRGYVPLNGIQADHSLKGSDISEAIEMAEDLPEDAFMVPITGRKTRRIFAGRSAPIMIARSSLAVRSSAP